MTNIGRVLTVVAGLACAGTALAQTESSGGIRSPGGSSAAAPRAKADVRGIAVAAFPEIKGLSRQAKPSGGSKKLSFPGPRPVKDTRSGWISGWPRIPALPQVKAKIAHTNRFISRAKAARNPSGSKLPPPPARPPPSADRRPRPPRPESPFDRDLRDLRTNRDPGAARRVATTLERERQRKELRERDALLRIRRGEVPPHFRQTGAVVSGGSIGSSGASGNSCAGGVCGTPIGLGAGFGAEGNAIDPRLTGMDPGYDIRAGETPMVEPSAEPEHLAVLEPSHLAQGDDSLRSGRLPEAAAHYVEHLSRHETDARAIRSLALAILLGGEPAYAEQVVEEAYRVDPGLAAQAVAAESLPEGTNLRNLVTAAVTRAQKAGTGKSWLLVSVLMQGEGRNDVAARMIARARDAGLEPVIADAMTAELEPRQ